MGNTGVNLSPTDKIEAIRCQLTELSEQKVVIQRKFAVLTFRVHQSGP